MGSTKIKDQGQSQGHVTFIFMLYLLKKKHNIYITLQHGLHDLVYSCVYYSIYKSMYT